MSSNMGGRRFAFRQAGDASTVIDVVTGLIVAKCEGAEHVECCHKLVAAMNGDAARAERKSACVFSVSNELPAG